MPKHCVVCNLPEAQMCEMCAGEPSLTKYLMLNVEIPEPAVAIAEVQPDTRINIGSGEDVCLA